MTEPGRLIRRIPEFDAYQSIKLAPNTAVPVTDRLVRLIDSRTFQRLRNIRQLSMSDRVFPSATHTRFAHALGVYNAVLAYLRHLDNFPQFHARYNEQDYLAVMLAALLHDIGHYPCSHQLDHLDAFPAHEELTLGLLRGELRIDGEDLPRLIREEFDVDPERIAELLGPANKTAPERLLLKQIIDSPLDADKCDYLPRDSYFCGVDYGAGFDRERFIRNLVPSDDGRTLCVHEKGLISAERFQLARYWMYRSVYWGHTVRALITMLGEAVGHMKPLRTDDDFMQRLLRFSDADFLDWYRDQLHEPGRELIDMLHKNREPYKRVYTISFHRNANAFHRLQDKELQTYILKELHQWSAQRGVTLQPHHLLWDVPPRYKSSTWESFPIKTASGQETASDRESPVIEALSNAFLQGVRQIRLFCHPRMARLFREEGHELPALNILMGEPHLFDLEP